ncbi:MAG: hypothetical protein ABJE95_01935 [Byssovorax sp.]
MAAFELLRSARLPHYPRARADDPASLALERHVAVRPGRFPVGLDRPDRGLLPPPDKVLGTAISVAAYMGRVDEVSKAGEVTTTLWERPNGCEGLTTLSVPEHFGGQTPAVGDLLWICTWVDVAPTGHRKDGFHIEVETRKLTDDDRARLNSLLAEIKGIAK